MRVEKWTVKVCRPNALELERSSAASPCIDAFKAAGVFQFRASSGWAYSRTSTLRRALRSLLTTS